MAPLTMSATMGANMDPNRAIVELAPIREFRKTVGNTSAHQKYIMANPIVTPNFPIKFSATK